MTRLADPVAEAPAQEPAERPRRRHEVVIIGAGLSGVCAAAGLLEAGFDDFVILDKGDEFGGTWRDNTYPGLTCDVPSALYSFSWAPKHDWSRLFAPQTEIRAYIDEIARRRGIAERARFGTEVTGAAWDDARKRWLVDTNEDQYEAAVVIACPGPWSEPEIPAIPGLERFEGEVFHSSRWNHDLNLRGRRVAVIGTGASAVQFVPAIQRQVAELFVFQRTAHWVLPKLDVRHGWLQHLLLRIPAVRKALRAGTFEIFEALNAAMRFPWLMRQIQRIAELHLRRSVPDRQLRKALTPSFTLGCKRILMSNDYYPSLTRENVAVVPAAVTEVRPNSVVDANGDEHAVDTIIFGTGFKILDMPAAEIVRGRDGRTLADVWRGSPRGYLGTTSAGFPNAFLMLGPNLGINTAATVLMEYQVDYIVDALRAMRSSPTGALELRSDVQDRYNEWLDAELAGTVWNRGGCSSYFLDSTGRNGFMYPRSARHLRRRLARFDTESYEPV